MTVALGAASMLPGVSPAQAALSQATVGTQCDTAADKTGVTVTDNRPSNGNVTHTRYFWLYDPAFSTTTVIGNLALDERRYSGIIPVSADHRDKSLLLKVSNDETGSQTVTVSCPGVTTAPAPTPKDLPMTISPTSGPAGTTIIMFFDNDCNGRAGNDISSGLFDANGRQVAGRADAYQAAPPGRVQQGPPINTNGVAPGTYSAKAFCYDSFTYRPDGPLLGVYTPIPYTVTADSSTTTVTSSTTSTSTSTTSSTSTTIARTTTTTTAPVVIFNPPTITPACRTLRQFQSVYGGFFGPTFFKSFLTMFGCP